MKRTIVVIVLLLAVASTAHAAPAPVSVAADVDLYQLLGHVELLEDRDGSRSLDAVLASPADWVIVKDVNPSFGFTSSVYWVRVVLDNPTATRVESILSLRYPLLDDVEVHVERPQGGFTRYLSGDRRPFSVRAIPHRLLSFPVTTEPGQTQRILVRIRTDSSMQIGVTLEPRDRYIGTTTSDQGLRGIYYGAMAVMALYNLFLYFAVRSRAYLYYVFYVVSIAMVHVMLDGSAARWLFPEHPAVANALTPLTYVSANIWPVMFVCSFLDTRRHVPRLHRWLVGYTGLLLGLGVLTLVAPYTVAVRAAAAFSAVTAILSISVGVFMLHRRYRPARFYVLSWTSFIGGVVVFVLCAFGVMPANWFTSNSMMIGSAIEVLLLSIALGDQINLVRREREEARAHAIAVEKDLALTGAVQQLFLPKRDSVTQGDLGLAGFCRPATHCGGDWWWHEQMPDGRLVLLLGDVTGHGAGAAMVTAAIAGVYRALGDSNGEHGPRRIIELLHRSMQGICGGSYHMTLSAFEVDPAQGRVKVWSAGAPAVLVQRADGRIEPLGAKGTPIGGDTLVIGEAERSFGPGDRLFAFSDGLTELVNANGRQLGYRGIKQLLDTTRDAPLAEVRGRLTEVLDEAHRSEPLHDDVTFVVVERAAVAQALQAA
jgi:serine phosphatase RsbU (regulator of sigma subunit)